MASNNSNPVMVIVEPSGGGKGWRKSERPFSIEALSDLPRQCYIFLRVKDYPPADGRRERLIAHFNAPEFLASRTCFELNGYFGNKATYGSQNTLTSYSTWFRCIFKMCRKVPNKPHEKGPEYVTNEDKDYEWFEMSFFSRWEAPDMCQVLCVDTPPDFPDELIKLLEKQSLPLDLRDPYAMHTSLLDQVIVYADISVWRVRDPVRDLEKARMRLGAIFNPIHEMSRHATHTTEVLQASIDTLSDMQERRAALYEKLGDGLDESYRDQAKDYAQFQISLVRSLKLRSESNQERLKNEIDLAFNNLARQDNDVQKSIALLTMIFLPATFISAIFSTTFFNMGDDGSWQVSEKQWIYWVTIIPATILSVLVWQTWVSYSDEITRFADVFLGWSTSWWTDRKKRRAAQKRAARKVEQA